MRLLNQQARYYSKQSYNLGNLEPVVAKPHSPDNKALAKDCRDTKIDRVYIGSCTGGKTEDFAAAARILQNEKAGFTYWDPNANRYGQYLVPYKVVLTYPIRWS